MYTGCQKWNSAVFCLFVCFLFHLFDQKYIKTAILLQFKKLWHFLFDYISAAIVQYSVSRDPSETNMAVYMGNK